MVLSLALLTALAIFAPSAQAIAPTPSLTGTNPPSPGASITPRIEGQAEGVITAVLRRRLGSVADGPVARASGSSGTVTIYANERNCTNSEAIAAEGSSNELEHGGIAVMVKPDSITTFYATLFKEGESSPCSKGLTYRQVTTPPEAPILSSVSPASPANDKLPRLFGSAASESIVSIYTTAACSGQPVGTGTAAAFASEGIPASAAENSVTTFYAKVTLAGIASTCSASSIEYQEVTPPPTEPPPQTEPGGGGSSGSGSSGSGSSPPPASPHLGTVPGRRSNDSTPLVTGSAPGAATVEIFENASCSGSPVAKGSAAQFASGFHVSVAENTATTFYGISLGAGGSRSSCSAPVVYFEDSTTPKTRITMGPGAKTRKRSLIFLFTDISGDPAGTSFLCKVNHGKWKPCRAPFHLHHLRLRSYVIRVKGIDTVGNEEKGGAIRRFKVVRRP